MHRTEMATGLASGLRGPALHQLSAGIQPCKTSGQAEKLKGHDCPFTPRGWLHFLTGPRSFPPQLPGLPSMYCSKSRCLWRLLTCPFHVFAHPITTCFQSLDSQFTEGEAEVHRAGEWQSRDMCSSVVCVCVQWVLCVWHVGVYCPLCVAVCYMCSVQGGGVVCKTPNLTSPAALGRAREPPISLAGRGGLGLGLGWTWTWSVWGCFGL